MSINEDILKRYVCKNPFEYFDVSEDASHICCPSWCSTDVKTDNGKLGWNDKTINKVRKSVLDGSYKYCDKNVCPSLNRLLNTGKTSSGTPSQTLTIDEMSVVDVNSSKDKYNRSSPLISKETFIKYHSINDINDINDIEFECKHILFGFDRSCNLKCPSCRSCLVLNDKIDSESHIKKLNILNTIESKLANTIESILITGSGDPFYSNLYRNYLINFNKSKYPKLKEIKIITNGIMLDGKLWNSLKSKEYIKSIEVSIDAGTQKTYENITRLNGNWDRLINNLNFLSTIKTVNKFYLSFVVSELNYMEMSIFYDKMANIFKGLNYEVAFRQHIYWEEGNYTKSEVDDISIFTPTHNKHIHFLEELHNALLNPFVNPNYHLI